MFLLNSCIHLTLVARWDMRINDIRFFFLFPFSFHVVGLYRVSMQNMFNQFSLALLVPHLTAMIRSIWNLRKRDHIVVNSILFAPSFLFDSPTHDSRKPFSNGLYGIIPLFLHLHGEIILVNFCRWSTVVVSGLHRGSIFSGCPYWEQHSVCWSWY